MPKEIDMTGKRYGKLLVLEKGYKNKNGIRMWKCRCDCGNEKYIEGRNLRNGNSKSCGCLKKPDLTGQKFGNYTVIRKVESPDNRSRWLCECKCGKQKIIPTCVLRSGKVKQCVKCHNKERAINDLEDFSGKKIDKLLVIRPIDVSNDPNYPKSTAWECLCDCGNITIKTPNQLRKNMHLNCGCDIGHKDGRSAERLYGIFRGMHYRCENPQNDAYKWYGAKGISVCEEWSGYDGYDNFKEWALNNGYSDNLSIDRIDFNGDYKPNNCRWADFSIQANNTSRNIFLTYKGKTKTMTQWAKELGLTVATIRGRLKYSDDIDKILSTPIDTKYHHGYTDGTFVLKNNVQIKGQMELEFTQRGEKNGNKV